MKEKEEVEVVEVVEVVVMVSRLECGQAFLEPGGE